MVAAALRRLARAPLLVALLAGGLFTAIALFPFGGEKFRRGVELGGHQHFFGPRRANQIHQPGKIQLRNEIPQSPGNRDTQLYIVCCDPQVAGSRNGRATAGAKAANRGDGRLAQPL